MANLNINRQVTDSFYRYKMPRIVAKVEGKGNGIKTVIENMTAVAKSLQRPPTYPTKYFGCELGAQIYVDPKNDRYIVNGAHDAGKLQILLDGFIRKFVLCEECDNPETLLVVKKGIIVARCIACGHQGNADMTHKLTTFIIKNPPDQEMINCGGMTAGTPNKKDKDKENNKKSAKKDKKDKKTGGRGDEDGQTNGHQDEAPDTPPEPEDEDEDFADDDWGDTSEAAVAERMKDLSDHAKALAINDDLEKTVQERVTMLYEFIKDRKMSGQTPNADKEIFGEAERLDMKDKAPLLLVELLLDVNILTQLKQYRKIFLRFTHDNVKAQRSLLGGLEQLIGNVHPDSLMPKVAHIFKTCYDLDILEEQVLQEWASKASKKFVTKEVARQIHERAAPFIQWLTEAEEESSGEDSDDDLEVVYDERAPVGVVKTVPAAVDQVDEGDDDVDIDAI